MYHGFPSTGKVVALQVDLIFIEHPVLFAKTLIHSGPLQWIYRLLGYRMYSRIVYTFFSTLCFVVGLVLFSVEGTANQITNLERLQNCAEVVGDSLLMSMSNNESQELCLRVVEHPASWIVDQAMIRKATERGFTVLPCKPPFPNDVLVAITNIGVRYFELDDQDYLRREVKLGLSASLPKQDGAGSQIQRVTETREIVLKDTIEAIQAPFLESPAYNFTVGEKIHRNKSNFWSKVVEPAVVIGSTVVMVLLLFTTRSQ